MAKVITVEVADDDLDEAMEEITNHLEEVGIMAVVDG